MNKVYACTDLHGMLNLWQQIDEYMDESDTLYFLGDAIDRGPDGMKIMKSLLTDSRVVYIMGNHENFICDEMPYLLSDNYIHASFGDWGRNGGIATIHSLQDEEYEAQKWLYSKILELPRETTYINKKGQIIHMTHAGNTPSQTEKDWQQKEGIRNAFLWNRNHFFDEWPQEFENWYEVHGHTPVQILLSKLEYRPVNSTRIPNILTYANGHKIDIDLASFNSNRTVLLDLDTLSPIYFSTKEENFI